LDYIDTFIIIIICQNKIAMMKRLTFTKYCNTNKLFYPLHGSIGVISFKAIFQDP